MVDIHVRRGIGQEAFHVVHHLLLEDQHRVGVFQGGPEHPVGIWDGGGSQDFDAGDVGVPAFQAVGVLGPEHTSCAGRHADHDRDVELAARHMQQGASLCSGSGPGRAG